MRVDPKGCFVYWHDLNQVSDVLMNFIESEIWRRYAERMSNKTLDLFYVYNVSQKINPLMFDNNFGKCGPILELFHQLIHRKLLYVYTPTISTTPAICCEIWKSKNVADFDSILNKLFLTHAWGHFEDLM